MVYQNTQVIVMQKKLTTYTPVHLGSLLLTLQLLNYTYYRGMNYTVVNYHTCNCRRIKTINAFGLYFSNHINGKAQYKNNKSIKEGVEIIIIMKSKVKRQKFG